MKYLFLTLMLAAFVACAENSTETNVKNEEVNSETPSSEKDKLIGIWYAKEVLINGKPDPTNFPVNNDELTFKEDMSVVSIDRTYDMAEHGTWEWVAKDTFAIVTEEERVVFQILKLTDNELETKVLTDEFDMVIKLRKEK